MTSVEMMTASIEKVRKGIELRLPIMYTVRNAAEAVEVSAKMYWFIVGSVDALESAAIVITGSDVDSFRECWDMVQKARHEFERMNNEAFNETLDRLCKRKEEDDNVDDETV